ncbi:hypothetical protein DIPPA_18317 [Diplonema papillatum]|nr:hypothetical protein DIPPA_18317 [Diplonema papillatum]
MRTLSILVIAALCGSSRAATPASSNAPPFFGFPWGPPPSYAPVTAPPLGTTPSPVFPLPTQAVPPATFPPLPPFGTCPSWREVASCGKCWATAQAAAACQPGTNQACPVGTTAGCNVCHQTEQEASQCTSCPASAPFRGCGGCFATTAEATTCGVDGCPSVQRFAGCGGCFSSEEEALSCGGGGGN